jgi:hypothetical protein
MTDPIVAYLLFTDGAKRPVYQEPSGKQYMIDDEGDRKRGTRQPCQTTEAQKGQP